MRHMQSLFRRSSHEMPGLNLASMPDLIFTVLFFFMIVTHMRHDDVKVRYEVPAGTEVQKLQQKSAVINVYCFYVYTACHGFVCCHIEEVYGGLHEF